jgi:hypothetical protein
VTVLHDAPVIPVDQSRTWKFIAHPTGDLKTVTCMPGCTSNHANDMETPTHPGDIWCQSASNNVSLPINENGTPEEMRVLSWTLNVRPFDAKLSQRLPHACVELMQDAWIDDLDPDGFAAVIDTLEERVKAMRQAHAELLQVRAEYRAAH